MMDKEKLEIDLRHLENQLKQVELQYLLIQESINRMQIEKDMLEGQIEYLKDLEDTSEDLQVLMQKKDQLELNIIIQNANFAKIKSEKAKLEGKIKTVKNLLEKLKNEKNQD